MSENPHLATARAAYGAALPDWIEVLAMECGRSSQTSVAKQLGRSAAIVSQVLSRKYSADMTRIEERVRGTFLNATLDCPALGELPLQQCQDWRDKSSTFAMGNPLRVRMYRACSVCPRNIKEEAQ